MLFVLAVFVAGVVGFLLTFEWGFPIAGTFLMALSLYTAYRLNEAERRREQVPSID